MEFQLRDLDLPIIHKKWIPSTILGSTLCKLTSYGFWQGCRGEIEEDSAGCMVWVLAFYLTCCMLRNKKLPCYQKLWEVLTGDWAGRSVTEKNAQIFRCFK
jgi:hypothetical protein